VTITTTPDLSTLYIAPDGTHVQVQASRGTQLITRHTRTPLDVTDPGAGQLVLTDSDTVSPRSWS
jgi:hypothetical protein